MKRGQPIKRKAWLSREGRRKRRERSARDEFRRVVLARAGGRCQRCRRRRRNLEAHHLLPLGRCGTHDPSNGAALCGGPGGCHSQIHAGASDAGRWLTSTAPDRSARHTAGGSSVEGVA